MEAKALKKIGRCSDTLGKSGIKMTAYLHALGESKGLNIEKHRKQVEKELKNNSEEDGSIPFIVISIFHTISIPYYLFHVEHVRLISFQMLLLLIRKNLYHSLTLVRVNLMTTIMDLI